MKKIDEFLPLISLIVIIACVNLNFNIAICIYCAIITFFYIFKEKFTIKKCNILIYVFALYSLVVSFIGLIDTLNFNFRIVELYKLFIKICIIIICFISVPKEKENIKKSIMHLRDFGIVLALLGIIEFIMKRNIYYNITRVEFKDWQILNFGTQKYRLVSIFLHPIVYSVFLNFFYWCLKIFPYKKEYLNYIFKILLIFNLLFTQSRSGIIAFVLSIIVYDYLKIKNNEKVKKKNILNFLIIFVVTVSIIAIFRNVFYDIYAFLEARYFQNIKSDYSYLQRTGAIINIINYSLDNIFFLVFGKGYGYSSIFMKETPVFAGFYVVDNQYFTYFQEIGLIGVFIFLIIIIKSIIKGLKSKKRELEVFSYFLMTLLISIFFFEGMCWLTVVAITFLSVAFLNSYVHEDITK